MKTSLLLPNRYKKIGWLLFPLGLIIWVATQTGMLDDYVNQLIKVLILTLSFFSFLIVFYFVSFSKEPIEDEYITSMRLKSFQISAIIQMIYFLMAFTSMFLFHFKPNGDSGLVLTNIYFNILVSISYYIQHYYYKKQYQSR